MNKRQEIAALVFVAVLALAGPVASYDMHSEFRFDVVPELLLIIAPAVVFALRSRDSTGTGVVWLGGSFAIAAAFWVARTLGDAMPGLDLGHIDTALGDIADALRRR
jgi:hypothetical protein